MSTWKRDFASGLIVLLPLLVILFVANWLYVRLLSLPFVPSVRPENPPAWVDLWMLDLLQASVAVTVFVLLVFSVGYLMRTTAGRLVEEYIDSVINRVPGLRVIYNASKLAVETALTGADDLQTPVKIEPWPGMRMTAFKTGKTTTDGRVVVFMPTSPNITTGFVMEVDPADVTETDERVEEALTRVLSAGFGEQDRGVSVPVEEASPTDPADGSRPDPGDPQGER